MTKRWKREEGRRGRRVREGEVSKGTKEAWLRHGSKKMGEWWAGGPVGLMQKKISQKRTFLTPASSTLITSKRIELETCDWSQMKRLSKSFSKL